MASLNNLDYLIQKPAAETDTFRWGTVTQASPLKVRMDGDSTPMAASPYNTVPTQNWAANDRVWCQFHGKKVFIIAGSSVSGNKTYSAANSIAISAPTLGLTGSSGLTLNGSSGVTINGNVTINGSITSTGTDLQPAPVGGKMVGSNASSVLVAHNTWTRYVWWSPTPEKLSGGMTSSSWNFVAPKAGFYTGNAGVRWTAGTTARRGLAIDRAATPSATFANRHYDIRPAYSSTSTNYHITHTLWCEAGDHIRLWVYQDTGADIGISADPAQTFFSVTKSG